MVVPSDGGENCVIHEYGIFTFLYSENVVCFLSKVETWFYFLLPKASSKIDRTPTDFLNLVSRWFSEIILGAVNEIVIKANQMRQAEILLTLPFNLMCS